MEGDTRRSPHFRRPVKSAARRGFRIAWFREVVGLFGDNYPSPLATIIIPHDILA